jgi:hypothetical protein
MSTRTADTIRTVDPAAEMMLAHAEAEGIPTVFSRAAAMAPCPIGEVGKCCKNCHGTLPVGQAGPARGVRRDAGDGCCA